MTITLKDTRRSAKVPETSVHPKLVLFSVEEVVVFITVAHLVAVPSVAAVLEKPSIGHATSWSWWVGAIWRYLGGVKRLTIIIFG